MHAQTYTGNQLRAAFALADLSYKQMAYRVGCSEQLIKMLVARGESMIVPLRSTVPQTLAEIFYYEHGVEFIEGGVRLRSKEGVCK